jgi:hypothetical protein
VARVNGAQPLKIGDQVIGWIQDEHAAALARFARDQEPGWPVPIHFRVDGPPVCVTMDRRGIQTLQRELTTHELTFTIVLTEGRTVRTEP